MSGNDFSWLATAFFIAYAVAEVPQGSHIPSTPLAWGNQAKHALGILLQRFPITRVLGVNVFFWGVTLCCSAAVKNYAGLCALRVLLGMMEAVIGRHSISIPSYLSSFTILITTQHPP